MKARQTIAEHRRKDAAGSKSGSSGKHRGIQLLIRLTAEQKADWQAKAARARRNLSDWIRVTLDDAR